MAPGDYLLWKPFQGWGVIHGGIMYRGWGRGEGTIRCGWNISIASCSQSAIVAGNISTKHNKNTIISRCDDISNYKCRSLSNCGADKTGFVVGNFWLLRPGGEDDYLWGWLYTEIRHAWSVREGPIHAAKLSTWFYGISLRPPLSNGHF